MLTATGAGAATGAVVATGAMVVVVMVTVMVMVRVRARALTLRGRAALSIWHTRRPWRCSAATRAAKASWA